MRTAVRLDIEAIARVCERYGVERLRVFGSVLTDRFDPSMSDIDFAVDFAPGRANIFHDYFDLKSDLEQILGRGVDLVMADAVTNPYFAKSLSEGAQDVYAA